MEYRPCPVEDEEGQGEEEEEEADEPVLGVPVPASPRGNPVFDDEGVELQVPLPSAHPHHRHAIHSRVRHRVRVSSVSCCVVCTFERRKLVLTISFTLFATGLCDDHAGDGLPR